MQYYLFRRRDEIWNYRSHASRTKDFSLVDTLGANLRSSMSIDTNSGYNGLDYRDGFQDNYIYKMDDVYATSYSMELILTII